MFEFCFNYIPFPFFSPPYTSVSSVDPPSHKASLTSSKTGQTITVFLYHSIIIVIIFTLITTNIYFIFPISFHYFTLTIMKIQSDYTRQLHTQALRTSLLTLILPRFRTGTVWFYTSTSNKRAARPKLYTKSLTRDLKLMYSHFTLVRISINL